MRKQQCVVIIVCAVLEYLCGVYGTYREIYIHSEADSYQNFFPAPVPFGSQWILEVHTSKFGKDFITFFASDGDRPLEYSCGISDAICDFSAIKSPVVKNEEIIEVYASMTQLYIPMPAMSGHLMLCVGPVHMFWKREQMKPSDYFCKVLDITASNNERIIEVTPQAKGDSCEEALSCPGSYTIYPEPKTLDTAELNIHTRYMTKNNYADMYNNSETEVLVPLLSDEEYTITIVGSLFHHLPYFTCRIQTPRGKHKLRSTKLHKNLAQLRHTVPARIESSGKYNITCKARYWDTFRDVDNVAIVAISSFLNITFFKGISIALQGVSGNNMYFEPNATYGNITVLCYSTSPIKTFKIKRLPDEDLPSTIHVKFVSSSPYDLVNEYLIVLTWLGDETSGPYQIETQNMDLISATRMFHIVKVKELKLFAGPHRLMLEEGSSTEFYCAAVSNLIETVKWEKEFGKLKENAVIKQIPYTVKDNNMKAFSLSFQTVVPRESGLYICTASNRFQTVTDSVKLIVWSKGTPYFSDDYGPSTDHPEVPLEQQVNVFLTDVLPIIVAVIVAIASVLAALVAIALLKKNYSQNKRKESESFQKRKRSSNTSNRATTNKDGKSKEMIAMKVETRMHKKRLSLQFKDVSYQENEAESLMGNEGGKDDEENSLDVVGREEVMTEIDGSEILDHATEEPSDSSKNTESKTKKHQNGIRIQIAESFTDQEIGNSIMRDIALEDKISGMVFQDIRDLIADRDDDSSSSDSELDTMERKPLIKDKHKITDMKSLSKDKHRIAHMTGKTSIDK